MSAFAPDSEIGRYPLHFLRVWKELQEPRRPTVMMGQIGASGVYAIFDGFEAPELFRVTPEFGKGLRLFRDNRHYQEYVLSLEKFEEVVVAYMIAEIKVKDERFLRKAMESQS